MLQPSGPVALTSPEASVVEVLFASSPALLSTLGSFGLSGLSAVPRCRFWAALWALQDMLRTAP